VTVWYRGTPVGYLQPDERGGFLFSYTDDWIAREDSFPVSLSLPLGETVDQDRADAFFSNLLPEGPGKERLCRQLGISPDNRYEILKAIGHDCAGALVIGDWPGDAEAEAEAPRYEPFGDDELDHLVRNRPALPVLADGEYVRFSLAGSASKWAVVYRDGGFHWPQGSAPSTHILKVHDPLFSHAPRNEAFTAFLAARLGLSVAGTIPSDDYLLIERYDRTRENGVSVRLHQEDAAQALGIPSFRKYQREGGVGVVQVLDLIRGHSRNPLQDQRSLITWQLANLILGNSDGHLKNISFLYDGDRVSLAPFYDMVCTRNYDGVERNLALSIGGGQDPGHIGRDQFREFARETRTSEAYIFRELDRIMSDLNEKLEDYAHDFVTRWGHSPVIDRVMRIVGTQIRRTGTLLQR
jgi:serine/threonine-protein kinase HipA